MIAAKLDTSELNRLIENLDQSPEVIKEAKCEAFESAAGKMKQALDSRIGGTGKVRSWQERYVGSKGGYAAVRPKAKTYTDKSNRYAVGYVTNAINSGHRFPGQGKTKASGIVFGKRFYEAAQADVKQIAQESVNQVAETLKQHLEG